MPTQRHVALRSRIAVIGSFVLPSWRVSTACAIGLCAAILLGGQPADAQTASQVVTFSVRRPPSTAMSAPSTSFTAPALRSGAGASRSSVSGSTYAVSTSESNQKIAASLVASLPRGVSLVATLCPPNGAWSTGPTALDDTARDVVVGVSRSTTDVLSLAYTLTARADAARASLKTVVTFTVTGGA